MASITQFTPPTAAAKAEPLKQTQAAQVANDKAVANQDAFGEAVKIELSAAALAVIAARDTAGTATQASSSTVAATNTNTAARSASPETTARSAAPAPAPTAPTITDLSADVTLTKRKIAAQVGLTAANFLVDEKANIDKAGLARLLAQEAAQAENA